MLSFKTYIGFFLILLLHTKVLCIRKTKFISDNFFLHRLFQNESSENYAKILNEFHIKLIKLTNSDCLIRTQGTIDDAFINYTQFNSNNNLWLQYFQHNYKNKDEEISLIDKLTETCFDVSQLANVSSLYHSDELDNAEDILEFILLQYYKQGCNLCEVQSNSTLDLHKFEIWLYSLLFVTVINITSVFPVIVIHLVTKRFYRRALMILISLAIGILCGSGFVHLIPRSFGLANSSNYKLHKKYIYKGLLIGGGIYVFFLIERIIKILVVNKNMKKEQKMKKYEKIEPKVCFYTPNDDDDSDNSNSSSDSEYLENLADAKIHDNAADTDVKIRIKKFSNKEKNEKMVHKTISTVAWVVIFSDCLHKLIDGLTIGASFTESITYGISLSTAIVFEEIPHQLGDFAILIHSGMSYRMALSFQIISATFCYTGVVAGVIVGRLLSAAPFIYAITGGIFIYIALVDMIPELNEISAEIEAVHTDNDNIKNNNKNLKHQFKILFIQNIAITFGFSLMYFLAILTN